MRKRNPEVNKVSHESLGPMGYQNGSTFADSARSLIVGNSPQVHQIQLYQEIANGTHAHTPSRTANGGLPIQLQSGIESLSGIAMHDVRVHYNSSKPAQLQAHAYARGTDIHLAPGQEKHLAHEAWHVVQQKQDRVKPTLQLKGVAINDDSALEREADVMGARAASHGNLHSTSIQGNASSTSLAFGNLAVQAKSLEDGKAIQLRESGAAGALVVQRVIYSGLDEVPQAQKLALAQNGITIIRKLGKGGFGGVWLATLQEKEVVVKGFDSGEPEAKGEFEILSQVPKGFGPAPIMRLKDLVVMERIVGDSVHNMLAKDDEKQGSRNAYALQVVEQMIGQVAGLHHARIAHGDIKLKNIMDTLQGTMRLVDFGKAQKIDAQATSKEEASYGGDIRMIGRLLPEMLPGIQDQYDDVAEELVEARPSDPALIAIKKFADGLQSVENDLGPEAILKVSREFSELKQALSKPRGGSTGSKKPDDEAAIGDILHDAKIKDDKLIDEAIAAYKAGKPYNSKAQIAHALADVLARLPDRVGEELVAYLAESYR